MKKTTIFSFFTLLLAQWHSISVESADTAEAKFIGAMQKTTENPLMAVIKDQDAASGWAAAIKRAFTKKDKDGRWAFFYTRTDPKAEFEFSVPARFCALLQSSQKENMLKQLLDMIFPRQKGSCDFKVDDRPIRSTAQVNTKIDEEEVADAFPKTTPYEIEVRILTNEQSLSSDDENYLFKVDFSVGGDINNK